MTENVAIAMNKNTNRESNPEKFDENEIVKEKLDLIKETDEIIGESENNQIIKKVAKPTRKIDVKNNFLDTLKDLNRLGYKSKLDLLIRGEISKLEKEVANAMGISVEEIRVQFLDVSKDILRKRVKILAIPSIFIISDYRTFLINALTVSRLRKINMGRY